MMDLQAAIGIHQLERVDQYWARRNEIWDVYNKAFHDLALELPASPEPNTRHGLHLYTIMVDEKRVGISRDAFLDGMTRNNVGAGVHYLSIAEHPYYQQRFGWHPEAWPNAMRVGRQTISLPFSAKLSDEDVADVIEVVGALAVPSTRDAQRIVH